MKDLLKKGLALGLGLAIVSKEQIEKFIEDLVKRGEVSAAESKELLNELIARGEEQSKELNRKIRDQVQKLLSDMNVPTKADLERLEQRIAELEKVKANKES